MTVLYGAVHGIRAIKEEAKAVHLASVPKCHLRLGQMYLHWSGSKLTADAKQAWTGTVEQANACRRTFEAAAGCKIRSVPPKKSHVVWEGEME